MQYKQGNLIEAFENKDVFILVHQCNCVTRMVSGFAFSLFSKSFLAYDIYLNSIQNNIKIGQWVEVFTNDQIIINLHSQYYPGPPRIGDSNDTRMHHLKTGLTEITNKYGIVSIPLIGSGLAADKSLKHNMTDLEYFKSYVAPHIDHLPLIVYHL